MMRLLSIILLLCMAVSNAEQNPGLKLRLSQSGIQYAANVATQRLQQQVQTMHIPDQSGTQSLDVGHVSYTISNIHVQSFTPPQTTVTTQPFKWTLMGTSAYLVANWHYEYKVGFIPIRDSGSLDVTLTLNLDTTAGLTKDNTGRPKISCISCDSDFTNVDVHFHGGASWLYNLFDGKVEDAIRDSLQDQICSSVTELINVNAESSLANIPVEVDLHDTITLDYEMVSDPDLTTTYIDFPSKGEFYWKTDKQEYPIPAKPLPTPPASHMLQFWLTEYSVNSLGYVEYKHGALVYNLTKTDLAEYQYILDTTCESFTKPCIGGVLPQIGKWYPNASVYLDMTVTQAPTMRINSSGIYGDWIGIVGYSVQTMNGSDHFLFSTNVNVTFNIEVIMAGSIIKANITEFKVNMTLAKSNIGDVDVDKINFIMGYVNKMFVIPKLNELGAEGIELPAIDDVSYVNPTIELLQNCIYVGVDLKYIGT